MGIGIVTATYIAASVLFILALGGLSNQKQKELFGMVLWEWHLQLSQQYLALE